MRERVKERAGLADFLQTRRAKLQPEQFGLATFQRRRARGLRREELAQLVGVGVSWYTWLEQGRDIQVSEQVLERLAEILSLNEEEREHLFRLARGPVANVGKGETAEQTINETTRALLHSIFYPARIFDRHLNVVGWNEGAEQFFGSYSSYSERERNSVWFHFMSPAAYKLNVHWEQEARRCLASLRARYDQYPQDRYLRELVADLEQASPEFRAWWPEHNIRLACNGLYETNHPQVGRLVWQAKQIVLPDEPDLQMVVYIPLERDGSVAKFQQLMGK